MPLDGVYWAVSQGGLGGATALSKACHPARAFPVLGAVALHLVSAGSLQWADALAVLSGQPVVVMAARAVLFAEGWRRLVGGVGLVAWACGLHASRRYCEVMSVLVAGAGLRDASCASVLVLGAARGGP